MRAPVKTLQSRHRVLFYTKQICEPLASELRVSQFDPRAVINFLCYNERVTQVFSTSLFLSKLT